MGPAQPLQPSPVSRTRPPAASAMPPPCPFWWPAHGGDPVFLKRSLEVNRLPFPAHNGDAKVSPWLWHTETSPFTCLAHSDPRMPGLPGDKDNSIAQFVPRSLHLLPSEAESACEGGRACSAWPRHTGWP